MRRHPVIEEVIAPVIVDMGYEFIGLECLTQASGTVLRIYIDADKGVGSNDCEKVSRRLGSVIDVELESQFKKGYSLEISSPGLDRKLFTLEQFTKQVGKDVKIRLSMPHEGQRNYKGVLNAVKEGVLYLENEGSELKFSFDDVEQANVIPKW